MTRTYRFLILSFIVFTAFIPPAAAKAGGDLWSVRCAEGTSVDKPVRSKCEIFQRLVLTGTQTRVVEFAIGFPEDRMEARGIFVLPLGILLEPGVQMQIDGSKPFTFNVHHCDAGGCLAVVNLAESVLEKLRQGGGAKITFQSLQEEDLSVDLSLKGFSAALEKVSYPKPQPPPKAPPPAADPQK